MPLPMVHLAVAVALYEAERRLPSAEFLLGSLAPDAIHMRPAAGEEDKRRIHLMEWEVPPQELARLFQRRYGLDTSHLTGFEGGYLAHLLTDLLWREAIITPFRQRLPPDLPEATVRSLYYRDTDPIDFALYEQMPWRPEVWRRLEAAKAAAFPPMLTAQEIAQWRERTLVWYENPIHNPQAEPTYITYNATLNFIKEAARQIAAIFVSLNDSPKVKDHRSQPG